eukprot:gnl/TRDRNA2_/TRDRNA2_172768_c1_seq11.p1 gnl/TRDRNA2_/TRDRNA2_172768_c1~~gnl/TRDRNA2_/TRDRNA2_172768_c1_seq11.p1  ORF type:complete len:134 (-),score=26.62 gnl/TRDRNA2_/TRDRNA2_172768_c1_seq11:86-439(-)
MDRGDFAGCANPSASLLGRIKSARSGVAQAHPMGTMQQAPAGMKMKREGQPTTLVQRREVNDFCRQHRLDDKATQALLEEDPSVQRAVMDRGDFAGCANPSASLLGRIKSAKKNGRG